MSLNTDKLNGLAMLPLSPVRGYAALPDPKQMTPEYLVELALQKYACACSPSCSKELHEWAMTLKAELLRRLALRPGLATKQEKQNE